MMEIIYFLLTALLVVPAALLIGCAVTEASLMKNSPQLSWLLPMGAMLASTLIQQRADADSGLGALLWPLLSFYGRYVSFGTAAGAAIGAILRWFAPPKEVSPV